jgi:beta-lactamase regulating signal transducer with metallopeptidase domain
LTCFAWATFRGANLVRAWRSTSLIFKRAFPRKLEGAPVEVYELDEGSANLFIAGILRPRLLISRGALELLDADELQAAIRHELAHTNAADNLKQMIVRFCSYPFLASLDLEWLRSVEIAADDRSVNDALTAADLASALIKVGTSSSALAPLGMSLVPEMETPVSDRVRRLLNWRSSQRRPFLHLAASVLFLQAAAVAVSLPWLIPQMHRFTELLMQ